MPRRRRTSKARPKFSAVVSLHVGPWLGHEKQCDCRPVTAPHICDEGVWLGLALDSGIDGRDVAAMREALAQALEDGELVYGETDHVMGDGIRLLRAIRKEGVLKYQSFAPEPARPA